MDKVEELALYHPSYTALHHAVKETFYKTMIDKEWPIDYIVGLSRGGLFPAMILSHLADIPMTPVKYSSKSGNGDNQNHDNVLPTFKIELLGNRPNLLIVDDISDSGKTLREVIDFYTYQGHNVWSAVLYYKEVRNAVVVPDMFWKAIPEDSPWVIFPWEC